ncbi:MAG: flagellar basal body rod protein FlgC [Plesiomonas shigelloides]
MSFGDIYDIAGSAMTAQTVRLNTVASNMANVDVTAGSAADAYRARRPVFSTIMGNTAHGGLATAKVNIRGIEESQAPLTRRYEPKNPQADKDGYVFVSNVNIVEEMADMMAASRSFETNVDVLSRVRSMQQGILRLGNPA